jgi:hypothetical protein
VSSGVDDGLGSVARHLGASSTLLTQRVRVSVTRDPDQPGNHAAADWLEPVDRAHGALERGRRQILRIRVGCHPRPEVPIDRRPMTLVDGGKCGSVLRCSTGEFGIVPVGHTGETDSRSFVHG